ncbi:HSP20 family protein [Desulfonatronum thiosulfatophilum]|uniref:HSP20 family protein n=1 Tax=Desulfonatronum thiosulfatophilum TaxID=617002 RepID=A0A1G6B6R5_9BACT|nr:Hsp20/alpha crystallin family protein [Desulfonatronum thiosulfatophilum]SDB16337.1 HSP20 family protein [Desulfonatronum thiosulfatophilum]
MVIDTSPFYGGMDNFDRVFNELWGPLNISQRKVAYPPLNISEDTDAIYVRCEIPGVNIEDIDLTFTDSTLVIKGERKIEKGKYFRQERPTGHFQRVVNVNAPIVVDQVKAIAKDGLLEIRLPKSEDTKPRKISIDLQ